MVPDMGAMILDNGHGAELLSQVQILALGRGGSGGVGGITRGLLSPTLGTLLLCLWAGSASVCGSDEAFPGLRCLEVGTMVTRGTLMVTATSLTPPAVMQEVPSAERSR